jgi:hypothetical protein
MELLHQNDIPNDLISLDIFRLLFWLMGTTKDLVSNSKFKALQDDSESFNKILG